MSGRVPWYLWEQERECCCKSGWKGARGRTACSSGQHELWWVNFPWPRVSKSSKGGGGRKSRVVSSGFEPVAFPRPKEKKVQKQRNWEERREGPGNNPATWNKPGLHMFVLKRKEKKEKNQCVVYDMFWNTFPKKNTRMLSVLCFISKRWVLWLCSLCFAPQESRWHTCGEFRGHPFLWTLEKSSNHDTTYKHVILTSKMIGFICSLWKSKNFELTVQNLYQL